MTAISLSGASYLTPALQQVGGTRPPGPLPGAPGGPMRAAAEALGLDRDDLVNALKDGKSLADVAGDRGVSVGDLASALRADMRPELAASGKADEIVSRMISERGGPQGPPPPGAGGQGFAATRLDGSASGIYGSSLTATQQSTLGSLSALLGTDSDSLLDSLRGGTGLYDLASRRGVSGSALSSVLQDGFLVDTRV
jgi:lambda repressor-like predicted transcriptional regulator